MTSAPNDEGVELRSYADLARLRPLGGTFLVVSPHLDDAVLSCGRLLGAHPGSAALTVFAGSDSDRGVVDEWDRLCGFKEGDDVVGRRRAEDRAALRGLGATPFWLGCTEPGRLTVPVDTDVLVGLLAGAVEALRPSWLVVPLGIRHPDHLLVHDLAILAARRTDVPLVVFQEMPYDGLHPADVQARLAVASHNGLGLTARAVPLGSRHRKFRAVGRYRTQLRGLGGRTRWGVTFRPERYWTASLM